MPVAPQSYMTGLQPLFHKKKSRMKRECAVMIQTGPQDYVLESRLQNAKNLNVGDKQQLFVLC